MPLLLEELKRAKSQNVKGQVVLALAKIGDARAVEPMVALLKDTVSRTSPARWLAPAWA